MKQSKSLILIAVIFSANLCYPVCAQGNQRDPGSVQNRIMTGGSDDLGSDLSNQAQLLNTQGQYSEAEQLFKKALAYWDKNSPTSPHSRPNCLTNFGLLYANQRRYDQAIVFYKQALILEQKSLPADDPLIALTSDNMAQSYRFQGKLQDAEPLYLKALAIEEKSMAPDDQDHAITMFNLSLLYYQQKEYSKCENKSLTRSR